MFNREEATNLKANPAGITYVERLGRTSRVPKETHFILASVGKGHLAIVKNKKYTHGLSAEGTMGG